ncbi:hypothetical protein A3K82_00185 [Candidatus Pacearchaeota archaeon RBG_19FT_COMBO_34_9]|nr:MAG: hypothetical protein A3K82_00185 [Candidatus Pacearchaeota archaeon RBG_19FT_COMBO_34_9]OGJ17331.1 MAG: hypothetical protein A3K74_01745 [Candidatus Pacearchaeota archaeon RBG_13_33_26]
MLLNGYGGIYKWDSTIDQDKAALEATLIVNLEKCMMLFALNASKNAKCPLNLQKASRFTAKNVMQRKDLTDIN